VAYRFLEAFLVLSPILTTVVAPVLAQSFTGGRDVLQRRFERLMHLLALLALGVSITGAMTAWRWFPLLPGFSRYHGAGVALAILSPAAALALIGAAVQSMLISAHLQRRVLVISAVGVVLNLAANLLLIPRYSYVGAAVATTVTEVAACAMSIASAHRLLSLHWPLRRLVRALPAALLLAAVLGAGYLVHPFAQLGIAVVVYVAALLPTGALRRDDLAGIAGVGAGP
jgi:O-antigen/teichoic acid export membrane protein